MNSNKHYMTTQYQNKHRNVIFSHSVRIPISYISNIDTIYQKRTALSWNTKNRIYITNNGKMVILHRSTAYLNTEMMAETAVLRVNLNLPAMAIIVEHSVQIPINNVYICRGVDGIGHNDKVSV